MINKPHMMTEEQKEAFLRRYLPKPHSFVEGTKIFLKFQSRVAAKAIIPQKDPGPLKKIEVRPVEEQLKMPKIPPYPTPYSFGSELDRQDLELVFIRKGDQWKLTTPSPLDQEGTPITPGSVDNP